MRQAFARIGTAACAVVLLLAFEFATACRTSSETLLPDDDSADSGTASDGGDSGPRNDAGMQADAGMQTATLRVLIVGGGTVSSTPTGIDACASDCAASFATGGTVSLTATPQGASSVFSGWSGGGCSGTGTCRVTLASAITITATFRSSAVTGTNYYVSNTGSNSANGLTLDTAFKTINYAVGAVAPGDVIEVRAGTYAESVVIRDGGSASSWITMRGYDGERPVIRGTGSGPSIYFYNSACDEDEIGSGSGNMDCYPMYWVLQGLDIRGSASGGGDGNAVKIDTPKVRLIGNRICCSVADVVKLVRTANDGEIIDNEIWQDAAVTQPATNAQGVDIVGADRVRVAGNYIHDVPDFGVYAKGNARDTIFEANRLVNIGRSDNGHALMLGQETDEERLVDGPYETYDGIVRNNVVVGSTWACLAVSSSSNARVYNNSCFNTAQSGQGSLFMSNESIIGQASTTVAFVNNIVVSSASRPVVKINDDAMTDFTTLTFAKNVYWTTTDAAPTFILRDSNVSAASWFTRFLSATSHADSSTIVNPLFENTGATNPLTLSVDSPARNAGFDTSAVVPMDRLGVARPQNGTVDIGAYEY